MFYRLLLAVAVRLVGARIVVRVAAHLTARVWRTLAR